MKIINTADWHLGKLVNGIHMTEEQKYLLEKFITYLKKEKPDCIIIAGDIYDQAISTTEGVQLLNDTLAKIILDLEIPVIEIVGNHDSPTRIDFCTVLMVGRGVVFDL